MNIMILIFTATRSILVTCSGAGAEQTTKKKTDVRDGWEDKRKDGQMHGWLIRWMDG